MSGPARRLSKRLRSPLICAALGAAALSVPASAFAAGTTVTTDTPTFTGRFESTCVTPASAQGPRIEFEVSTLVGVKTTAGPNVGDEVSVQSYAAWQLGPDAVRALGTVTGLNVPDAILSVSPLVLGVSGTSSTSVQLGEGTNPNNGAIFRGVLDRAPTSPTTAGTFGPSFSAGRVQLGADAVTFTGSAFRLSAYIAHATSSVDGLTNTPFTISYDCTPTAPATIGSVPVTATDTRPVITGAFESRCVGAASGWGNGEFDVTTVVGIQTPADLHAGDDVVVASSATVQLNPAAVAALGSVTRLRIPLATVSTTPLKLGVVGTSSTTVQLGEANGAYNGGIVDGSLGSSPSTPAATGTFGPSVVAGKVQAGASSVTFTGQPFRLSSRINNASDTLDGLPVTPFTLGYDCTPTGSATIGSAPVEPSAPVSTPGSFGAAGTATLKNLVKGSLPLTGSLSGEFDPAGAFTGNLSLTQGTAKLTALGILPVVAKVALVQTAPLTGTQSGSSFSGTAKVRVKVPSASVFGVQLGGGANCQATQVSTIPLKSTGSFTPAAGGTLTGTFSISNLSGCGALNGIVSSLTAGSGNSLALALTPAPKG